MTYEEKYQAVATALQDRRVLKVAAATGVSRGTIYSILKNVGRKPLITTLNRLANYLGLEH